MRITILAILLATPQDEKVVAQAAKDTLAKGSFTLRITPAADLKDALPADKAGVVGVPVLAELTKDGIFRVTDGASEIIGRDKLSLVKTKEGWRNTTDVVGEMVAEIVDSIGKDDANRKNVSSAKAAYRRLLAMVMMAARSLPPATQITRVETDFKNLKKGATEVMEGKRCQIYEGEMKEAAAALLLQGPYEQMVKDGTLVISEAVGRGRVWVTPDGLVRRTEFKAAGIYTVLNKESTSKKSTPTAVSVTTDVVKVGETAPVIPQEVQDKLKLMELDAAEREKEK